MMKTIFFAIVMIASVTFTSCTTQNEMAKAYGGTATINLPKGERLVEVTWKDCDLWYLTEPMDFDYTPKTKIFREDSNWGIMEGKVIFVESK